MANTTKEREDFGTSQANENFKTMAVRTEKVYCQR